MYSQTFIGRDVFAAVWGIGVLAAVAAADTMRFPFDQQLREFISAQRGDFAATWLAIRDAACLSDDIMWIPENEAPWSGVPNKYPDLLSLKSHLVLAHPNPEIYVGTDGVDRLTLERDNIREAVRHLLGSLLGGLLSGRWALCEPVRDGIETPPQLWEKMLTVFRAIAPVLRESELCTAEPEALLAGAWTEWRQAAADAWIADPSTDAGFRNWLKILVEWRGAST
ncbi:hypothetical protein WMF30_42665 [Sorangium sp. So ce134]